MMKLKMQIVSRFVFFSWILGLIAVQAGTFSAKAENDPNLERIFSKLIYHSGIKPEQLGLYVVTGTNGNEKVVYDQNGEKPFIPASVTKILTAGAVLTYFPPGFTFKTELLTNAIIEAGTLKGPLYLRGGGDPSFVSESMWVLVDEFSRRGIRTISGDIIVDDSRFDEELFDESRESKRVDRAYDAPVGAMSFNWNSVNVFVSPGAKVGDPAIIHIDPPNDYIEVLNRAKTSRKGQDVAVSRLPDGEHDRIMVTGAIGRDHDEIVIYKGIRRPALWAGSNLVTFLKQRGIAFTGQIKRGATPTSARVIAKTQSHAIHLIVADMTKFSNNFVAEMLTKNMAAEAGHLPGNIKDGVDIIKTFLDKVGVERSHYELINPAGFTLDNKFEPQDLAKVLSYLRRQFTIFPEFLSALPIAGVDGTLKSRLKGTSGETWVRAKTGLLNGVVGLAGYAGKPDGTMSNFVFIYNGKSHEAAARDLFDRLAAALTK